MKRTHVNVTFSGFDGEILKRFSKHSLIIGVLLFALGLVGLFLPQVMSLVASTFLGWLLLAGGMLSLYYAFLARWRSVWAWLKAILLTLTGAVILLNPLAGILTVALLLAVYLFMDAFGGFALAQSIYPHAGWSWMALNGVISLLLGGILVFAWPADTVVLVGLYLGISLLFDGIALVMLGLAARKLDK